LDLLQANPNMYVGTWLNEDTLYLDICNVFDNEENAYTASKFGDQEDYYSVDRGEVVNVHQATL
jgi:hypothetical protein